MSVGREESFNLTDFATQFSILVASSDTAALENYFQENITKLRATIKSGQQIAVILNILSLEHWNHFLSRLDQAWFKSLFADGTNLGILLDKIVSYKNTTKYSARTLFNFIEFDLVEDALKRWQLVLNYLNPEWQEMLVDRPSELNALLSQLDGEGDLKTTKKIAFFLDNFLNQEKITNIDTLLAILSPSSSEVKCLNPTTSLQFIQTFSAMKIYKILLRGNKFENVLSTIDKYKDKPCQRALLFAITKAWYYEREKNAAEYTSQYEEIRGYTRQFKLASAMYLMDSIADQRTVIAAAGIVDGPLGHIFTRYTESFAHTIKLHS